jgi:hypothetical protein
MNDHNDSDDLKLRWFFGLFALLACVWAISGWLINCYYSGDVTKRGSFGDMFGAVNALFSGAALAGVIVTILLQRKELALQRKDLERAGQAHEQTAKLTAYTALLNAHTQEAYHIQSVIEKHFESGDDELMKKFREEIRKRNEYVSKLAQLVNEEVDAKNSSTN